MFINIDEFIEQTDEIKALETVRALQTFLDSKVIFDEKVVKTLHSGMYTAEMDGVSGFLVMIKDFLMIGEELVPLPTALVFFFFGHRIFRKRYLLESSDFLLFFEKLVFEIGSSKPNVDLTTIIVRYRKILSSN